MDGKINRNTTGEKHNFELCFIFCFVREVATQHKVMLSRDTSERLFGYIRESSFNMTRGRGMKILREGSKNF